MLGRKYRIYAVLFELQKTWCAIIAKAWATLI